MRTVVAREVGSELGEADVEEKREYDMKNQSFFLSQDLCEPKISHVNLSTEVEEEAALNKELFIVWRDPDTTGIFFFSDSQM